MQGLRTRRLYPSRNQEPNHCDRLDQSLTNSIREVRLGRQFSFYYETAQYGGFASTPSRTTKTLPQTSHRWWRSYLGHAANIADIDSKFERGFTDRAGRALTALTAPFLLLS